MAFRSRGAAYVGESAVSASYTAQRMILNDRSIGIEVTVPFGGMIAYAALALRFHPLLSRDCAVVIQYRQHPESTADKVPGLTREFAEGVRAGISAEMPDLPCGIVETIGAAYDRVGSSPWIFSAAAKFLARLALLKDVPDAKDLASMLERTLQA